MKTTTLALSMIIINSVFCEEVAVNKVFLKDCNLKLLYSNYQGFDLSTGERMVICLKKKESITARLVIQYGDSNRVYGDDREILQRFEISGDPKIIIQTWEWENYVNGDLGLRRAINIKEYAVTNDFLKSIYGAGDIP